LDMAAACARGRTIMHALGELRVKDSDRLAAIVAGLTNCGVRAETVGDSLIVEGDEVAGGAIVRTYGDHRIAMSFLVLGLAARAPVAVDRAEMIATSFPPGTCEGRTTGTPISLIIDNVDARPDDYAAAAPHRAGHADAAYEAKYGLRDPRGGGRASARETAARVAAGAVARLVIPQVE